MKISLKLALLEVRFEDAEQYSRSNTIEIHGISLTPSANFIEIVKSVSDALECPIKESKIDAYHRLGSRDRNGHPPGIIVKLVRRFDAHNILAQRKKHRKFNTNHIGLHLSTATANYVNESICPARRKLYNAARKAKIDKH